MIRSMTPQDRAFYLDMARAFYASEAVWKRVPEIYHQRTFDEIMRSGAYAEGYIFEVDGVSVGYGITAQTFSAEAGGRVLWLEELYIAPEYRCRGLGREFFRRMQARLGGEFVRLRLEIEPDNTRAQKLYEQMGFTCMPYRSMVRDAR